MMTYNTIKICMFVLFFHSMKCDLSENHQLDIDAAKLMNALCASDQVDKQIIIEILVGRSNAQRLKIKNIYENFYDRDLVYDLMSKLDGNLKNAVAALMVPNDQFYAQQLLDSFVGLGADNEAVAEILGSMNNAEIMNTSSVYEEINEKSLEEDLKDKTSGLFRELMLALYRADREEDKSPNEDDLIKDIEILKRAEIQKNKTAFINILTSRSFRHLNRTLALYNETYKKKLRKTIENLFSGSLKYGLLTIVNRIEFSKDHFYRDLLFESMTNANYEYNNDRQLIRIIVGRSEIDLRDIIRPFYKPNEPNFLVQNVTVRTSGQYKELLLALLNKQFEEF